MGNNSPYFVHFGDHGLIINFTQVQRIEYDSKANEAIIHYAMGGKTYFTGEKFQALSKVLEMGVLTQLFITGNDPDLQDDW